MPFNNLFFSKKNIKEFTISLFVFFIYVLLKFKCETHQNYFNLFSNCTLSELANEIVTVSIKSHLYNMCCDLKKHFSCLTRCVYVKIYNTANDLCLFYNCGQLILKSKCRARARETKEKGTVFYTMFAFELKYNTISLYVMAALSDVDCLWI